MGEAEIRPGNLTTLITFDGGAEWSKVQGPRNDTSGHPIPGCFDVSLILMYDLVCVGNIPSVLCVN